MNRCGVRLHIRGNVQGVGFRYFCYRAATRLDLPGFAGNMPDGSVVVEAEGDRSQLEILIQELKVGPMHAAITGVDVTWTEPTGKYSSFDIR